MVANRDRVPGIEEHAAEAVADWPPFTPEQRGRLALLLRNAPVPREPAKARRETIADHRMGRGGAA